MKELRIIFCGDRNWTDQGWIIQIMSALQHNLGKFTVIEGEAPGADKLSRKTADEVCELPWEGFPAKWERYGRAAGPIRNREMLTEGKADGVVAFHYNIEKSKGTADMVKAARKAGLPTWICTDGPEALCKFILELKQRTG